MSIFSESFPDFIKNELNERQAQMGNSSKDIKYLTSLMSRTAWVRMTSGVNVLDSKGEYTNEVAKSNVITNVLGGTDKNENGNGGFRSISIEVHGRGASGLLKNESGVPRLVRMSPFNAKGKRNTSFSMVEIFSGQHLKIFL
jgi:hypothetical protein